MWAAILESTIDHQARYLRFYNNCDLIDDRRTFRHGGNLETQSASLPSARMVIHLIITHNLSQGMH